MSGAAFFSRGVLSTTPPTPRPLEATMFEIERLRCNACREVFTANEPEVAGPAKYDATGRRHDRPSEIR